MAEMIKLTMLNIVLLIAASQALLLGVLILNKYRQLLANQFLSGLMLAYSLVSFHLVFTDSGVYVSQPLLMTILSGLSLLVPPLHFLYSKYLIYSPAQFLRKDLLHFLPYIIAEFGLIFYALFWGYPEMQTDEIIREMPVQYQVFNWILLLQAVIYLVATLVILRRYHAHVRDVFSNIEKIHLRWLFNITLFSLVAWLFFFAESMIYSFDEGFTEDYLFSSFAAGILILIMGYIGLLRSEIYLQPQIARSMRDASTFDAPEKLEEKSQSPKKYEKSGLSEVRARQISAQLIELMETQKLYQDPALTLSEVSQELGVSNHNISEVINRLHNKNFFDFVNSWRLNSVKSMLIDPDKNKFTILAIAMEAGFNSKTAFNTFFKRETGQTPSEFRKSAESK